MHHQAGVNCEKFTEVKFRDMLLTRTGHQDRRLNYHSPSQTCGRSNLNQNLKPKSNFRFIRERPFAIPSFHQKWRPGALSPAPPCRVANSGAQSKWWRDTYSTDVNNANNYVCREVGDSSQSFSSDTLQGISSEWSGDTTELVYIQRRRDLIG